MYCTFLDLLLINYNPVFSALLKFKSSALSENPQQRVIKMKYNYINIIFQLKHIFFKNNKLFGKVEKIFRKLSVSCNRCI